MSYLFNYTELLFQFYLEMDRKSEKLLSLLSLLSLKLEWSSLLSNAGVSVSPILFILYLNPVLEASESIHTYAKKKRSCCVVLIKCNDNNNFAMRNNSKIYDL